MTDKPKYYDVRQDFWKKQWASGDTYEAYLDSSEPDKKAKWDDVHARLQLTDEQAQTVDGFARELNVLVLSGVWCGDCARQGPIIRKIEEANAKIRTRFVDNRSNPELQDELRINGAMKVPVAVFLNEDFFELGRFGDKHAAYYRIKLETELGPACASGVAVPDDVLAKDLSDWVDLFVRMHAIVRLAPYYRNKYAD